MKRALLLLVALPLAGCGSAPPPSTDMTVAPDSLAGAAINDVPLSAAEAATDLPALAAAPGRPQPISSIERLVAGFRVQLFQSTSLRLAESFRDNAAATIEEAVYVEYEAPLYKVRAGNFRMRAEAEAWAATAASRGLGRADVVGTLVDTNDPRGSTAE